jgi:hypothetical protein
MRKSCLRLTLACLLVSLSGCSLFVCVDIVPAKGTARLSALPQLDPNSPACPFNVETDADGIKQVSWLKEVEIWIDPNEEAYMQYSRAFVRAHLVPEVEGYIGEKRRCVVALDTGASHLLLCLTQGQIVRHEVPIYPVDLGPTWGICQSPKIRFGNISLKQWPATCLKNMTRVKILGVPVGHKEAVIVPLPVLSKFKFMEVSTEKEYALLSAHKSFEPDDPLLWSQYDMKIRGKETEQELFVTIPVNGEEMHVKFDTCSSDCLDVPEVGWERLAARLADYRIFQGSSNYVAYGVHKHKSAKIKSLQVGDRVVRNAEIDIRPAASDLPALEGDGLMGMGFFRDTTIVLDFERNILWVRNKDADGGG